MTPYEIQGKTILVTGANRGIGKAIVEEMLRRDVKKIYAAVRHLETAQPLVDSHDARIVPIRLDLEDPQSIRDAALSADDVEVVINNAGVLRIAGPLDEGAIEALQYEINLNVFGLIRVAQAFAPVLKRNGGGALVQLNSVVSLRAFANLATYSASKAASYSITQSLREVLGEQGTRVVSVHPGPIATDMASNAGLDEIAEPPLLVAEAIIDALREGRFHAYPDSMARQFGGAYESFSKTVIEASLAE